MYCHTNPELLDREELEMKATRIDVQNGALKLNIHAYV